MRRARLSSVYIFARFNYDKQYSDGILLAEVFGRSICSVKPQ